MNKYIIQPGDTLGRIAKRLNIDMQKLADHNSIKNVNRIYAGDTLKVPPKDSIGEQIARASLNEFKTEAEKPESTKTSRRMNPRQRAMLSRREGTPTESRSLMSRSRRKTKGKRSLLGSAPVRAYAAGMLSSGVLSEDFFRPDELKKLTDIVVGKVKRGSNNVFYGDYDEDAGSKISYGMEIPSDLATNLNKALKFTTGRMDIVQHKGKVLGADEFDFEGKEKISQQSLADQVKFLADRTGALLKGDIGLYGAAHSFGEVFNPPGEGPSFRINFGTPKELGIDQETFKNLPTLESYEKENAYRIKQRPLRDFFRSLGVIDV
tara:strand:+ start:10428 stop:11390 length:963 start_codon:yes stop_codon:yes gene_type:complete